MSYVNPAHNHPPAVGLCCRAAYLGCCRCAADHVTASPLVQVLCWLVPLQRQALRLLQQSGSRAWRLGPEQKPMSKAMERQQPTASSSMDRPMQQLPLCQQSRELVQVIWRLECQNCQRVPKLAAWHAKTSFAKQKKVVLPCSICSFSVNPVTLRAGVLELGFRLPDGKRLQRRFEEAATVGSVLNWLGSSTNININKHTVTMFPRKVISQHDITLKAAGVSHKEMLSVQLKSSSA